MKILRRSLLLLALMLGWAWVGSDRLPSALGVGAVAEAKDARWEPGEGNEQTENVKGTYDLSALRVFTKVIMTVKENYVDPKRINPKEMLVQSLEYVERTVPDVVVDGTAETGILKLNVDGHLKELDIRNVDSMWKMSFTLKDAFEFISHYMRPMEDKHEVEYAAINGMLSTLDPHSVLLKPEYFREMKLTTKGEFGGLGFMINMPEGNLTVVKILPKTPAARAGMMKGDQIKRINDESTVNMDLNEAVGKLRGPIDSKVSITVERKTWDKPQNLVLARAMITVESVQAKLLSNDIGYVRIKGFQGNTTRSLEQAISEMKKQAKGPLKGLVMDLRGNPGGLLDQAQQVSDMFLSDGVIVSTVGLSDRMREEKRAHKDEDDEDFPMAVLVNAGSASASEIVAGALKNLNRATIIGRQTFGKGSVQILYDYPDESALKLTVAKYLTPGDISIQEVGIVPDIELVPTRVAKDHIDVFAPRKVMGEADLEHHFGNPSNATAVKKREDVIAQEKPLDTLRYLKDEPVVKEKVAKKDEEKKSPVVAKANDKPKKKGDASDPLLDVDGADTELDDQLDAESQDEVKEDFEVQFARDFVLAAPFVKRDQQLQAVKAFVQKKRTEEDNRIASAITSLGVDWTAGAPSKAPKISGVLRPNPDRKWMAGETLPMELTVENTGQEPLARLRAWTESDNPYVDHREFLIGSLKPGEKKTATVNVKIPKHFVSRHDTVMVKFQSDTGNLNDTAVGELNFVELARPQFSYNYQIIDRCEGCNQDGQVQPGESFGLLVDVTNVGAGPALATFATIRNASDSNVFIEKGRFKLGELAVGETKTARFSINLRKAYKDNHFALKMAVVDEQLQEFMTEKLQIPVAKEVKDLVAKKGELKANADATVLYNSVDSKSIPVALVAKGTVWSQLAASPTMARVELDKDRFAFVKLADFKSAKGGKPATLKDVQWQPLRKPPVIALNVDPIQGGVVTDSDKFTLTGTVSDPQLLDMFVTVNDQKAMFQVAQKEENGKIKFSIDLPLKEGANWVSVIARESQDFEGRETIMVRRRPVAVAQQMKAVRPVATQ